MTLFRCPYCGLETQVDPAYAGASGPCAGCGAAITIPGSTSTDPADPSASRRLRLWLMMGLAVSAILIGIVLSAFLVVQLTRPAVQQARQEARRRACQQRVATLVQALIAYRNDHGTFPPAYTVDEQGRPLHSWRVLVLPYLGPENAAIYQELRIDEPWNSAHNQTIGNLTPAPFVCPEDRRFSMSDTSYFAIVGDEYAFRPGVGITADQIRDDLASTLLVAEGHGSRIHWMSPVDLTRQDLAQGINSGIKGSCGSHHPGGLAIVGTADGRGRSLLDTMRPDRLHRMATIAGHDDPQPTYAP